MRSLLPLAFCLCVAAPVFAAELDKKAGEVVGKIDELSIRLFLHQADSAYAAGKYSEARTRFTWLAERGSPEAGLALGIMYEEGQGIPRDYAKAVDWYQRVARQGLAPAQLRLSRMYYFGRHVRQDNFLAYVWASVAASQGDEMALSNRIRLGKLMDAEEVTSASTLAEEWAGLYNR